MPEDGVPAARPGPPTGYPERLLGAWTGRVVGNMLGKPVELGDYWTPAKIAAYLRGAGAYPLADYVPLTKAASTPQYRLRECRPETTRGNIDGSSRDDDVDYTILNLHVLQKYGPDFSTADIAAEWLALLPYLQTFTAERVAIRNLVAGLPSERCAAHRNPYREWIGALIRGDVFGYVCPGAPARAARLAFRDASLSHTGNGVYGEVWAAALVASAFTAGTARAAVDRSLAYVPRRSRLAEALRATVASFDSGATWEETIALIGTRYGHYSWIHTVNNAAVIAAGLLHGDGDFTRTIGLTVQGGLDTDSNGATAGSVAGALSGAARIPAHWTAPLHDRVRSAVFGFDGSRITGLARRTARLAPDFAGG
ncbi:ADP-ribosylglycohydrolase family protein [Streptomyces sp. TS71-3]|uniref:ADP-ribosylglycohydrolase family protein n=1 Tax=Streptomyces sp. TS71-3 TaxID=2733862 RepID=UPI0020183055|nr:ADP-ribosylglycohydrolase family protein [Streptomyces sp. TS71-3]